MTSADILSQLDPVASFEASCVVPDEPVESAIVRSADV